MKQEDVDLLLKDLCSRLPYNVKVNITSKESKNRIVHLTEDNICHLTSGWWSECKPFLFPLSSMTEEQRKEFDDLTEVLHDFMKNHAKGNDVTERFFYTQIELWKLKTDWLNKNHFDYRGLIEKGLAIDATELNIY